jgi:hypothetical protein
MTSIWAFNHAFGDAMGFAAIVVGVTAANEVLAIGKSK